MALSLPKAERFSGEDVLEQPNEINHWILALALQTWRAEQKNARPKRSLVQMLWPGGGGSSNKFQRSPSNSKDCGVKRSRVHQRFLAPSA